MSLSTREQQALDGIENRLVGSDPRLAGLLATFTRMTSDEGMPTREEVRIHVSWLRRLFRRARQPLAAGLGGVMALLWVLIAVGMIAVAVVLSGSGSGGACSRSRAAVGATPVACAAQAPARSFRPLAPRAS